MQQQPEFEARTTHDQFGCEEHPVEFLETFSRELPCAKKISSVVVADHEHAIEVPIDVENSLRSTNERRWISCSVSAHNTDSGEIDIQVLAEACDVVRLGFTSLANDQQRGKPSTTRFAPIEAALLPAHLPMLRLVVAHAFNAGCRG